MGIYLYIDILLFPIQCFVLYKTHILAFSYLINFVISINGIPKKDLTFVDGLLKYSGTSKNSFFKRHMHTFSPYRIFFALPAGP